MSDKRYQVFVSSTFRDLIEERQAVLKAILELDHMPAGMELFPAADESSWQLIKDVIDSSDYYVLILGGRYGSLDEKGLGYTEKEYDYAISTKKPIIPLLYKTPDNLPRDKTETDPNAWKRLVAFRKKAERKHTCVYWETAEELKSKVIVGITSTVKKIPAAGWVRADSVPTDATIRDVLALQKQVTELEKELEHIKSDGPADTEHLLQGDDSYKIDFSFYAYKRSEGYHERKPYTASTNPTWNEIFAGISPTLISEASEYQLRNAFVNHFTTIATEYLEDKPQLKEHSLNDFEFDDTTIDTCLVQFRALGMICESDKKRSVKDTDTYWKLTPYGDRLMVQLRALRREEPPKRLRGEKPEAVSTDIASTKA